LQYPHSPRHLPLLLRKRKPNLPRPLLLRKRKPNLPPKAKPSLQIRKPKPLRSNPSRFILLHVENNDCGFFIDDESIHVGYRRPELVEFDVEDENDLSDYVKFRLWLARQLALMKYEKTRA
jgi:hypothetical protein